MAKVIPSGQAADSKVVVTFVALLAAVLASAEENTSVDFVRDVQPILQAACFKCHGPEKQSGWPEAELNRASPLARLTNSVIA